MATEKDNRRGFRIFRDLFGKPGADNALDANLRRVRPGKQLDVVWIESTPLWIHEDLMKRFGVGNPINKVRNCGIRVPADTNHDGDPIGTVLGVPLADWSRM